MAVAVMMDEKEDKVMMALSGGWRRCYCGDADRSVSRKYPATSSQLVVVGGTMVLVVVFRRRCSFRRDGGQIYKWW